MSRRAGAACADCGRAGLTLRGGRCGSCRATDLVEACSRCGLMRPRSTRTAAGEPLCGTCRLRVRAAARTEEFYETITVTVSVWLGGVDAAMVRAAVVAAAPNFRQAEWLAAALGEGPSMLHASTAAPPVVDRLVTALLAAGVVGIEAPCCVRCGRSGWLSQRLDGHRACTSCAHSARGEACSMCGTTRAVTTRTAEGAPVCSVCHRNDRTRWEPCARCSNVRAIVRRLDNGTGLCKTCNRKVAVCSICGNERLCAGIREGNPRCDPCSARRALCSWCGRTAVVRAVWATGPVCSNCRYKGLSAKAICDGCGGLRRPDPRHPSGRCSDCVGLPRFNVCTACGTEDRIYRAGRCMACLVPMVFDTLTAGPVDLSPLRATIAASDRPRAVLRWIETPFVTGTLGRLASGELALTHPALDELGDDLAITRLRGVLVQAGLLDTRNEAVARLEAWITTLVAAIDDPEDRRMVDAFAAWHVLRRVRRRGERRDVRDTSTPRSQVRRAIEFLAFLRSHDRTVATCTQADLELWLAGAPARRYVADFVKWAHRRGLVVKLDVARQPDAWPARTITTDELRGLVDRLLDDSELHVADRVAGLFVVCYAQLVGRIVRLRVDHVTITDTDEVTIRFGRDDVQLPPPIAALVRELVASRRGRSALDATSPWLFPGSIPGRPLHAESLRRRLGLIGVPNMAARTATLLDLATEVPPTVLADLVGLDPLTAARWNRAAGGDWATYAAIRASTAATRSDGVIINS